MESGVYAASASDSSSRASSSRSDAARWSSSSTVVCIHSLTTNASRCSATSAGESIGRMNSHTAAVAAGSRAAAGIGPFAPSPDPAGSLESWTQPEALYGSDYNSVIRPRAISTTPITAAPITAAVRPLRAIQVLNRVTLSCVDSGANA